MLSTVLMRRGASHDLRVNNSARIAATASISTSTSSPSASTSAAGAKLYPAHVPTTSFEKMQLAVVSMVIASLDPSRLDMVAAFVKSQRILREKPRIWSDNIDLDYLRSLPKDTFGYVYVRFLDSNGYALAHDLLLRHSYRETHDFTHVLFDLSTSVFAEFVIKYAEVAQTKLPMNEVVTYVGWLKISSAEILLAAKTFVPWAKRAGCNAAFLMNVAFEEEFETPLEELHARLNIEVAPTFPTATAKWFQT